LAGASQETAQLQGIVRFVSRLDLHVHSTASQHSRLGVQRALGLPECATPPEEAYALAKRRGMDFVTLTDHDAIDGALALADRPDAFVSEELTTWFRGEPQAVHVLCLGITPDDHARLQERARDVERAASYLHEHEIACALAHPFYAVRAPLAVRHRRRLAQLFEVWEVRNGARAPELNAPAAVYVETHGGTGVGGSDDHAGVDVGRTYTETPPAATWGDALAHLRAGRAVARGAQGSAAKWAHGAMALAVRALGRGDGTESLQPAAVLAMVQRVLREGEARRGALGADLRPHDARALLHAWLDAVGLEGDGPELLAQLQDEGFAHADLERRARRAHERRLGRAVADATAGAPSAAGLAAAAAALLDACVPAIPYAPAAAFLGREKDKLAARGGAPRVALVADGLGAPHGVTSVVQQVRDRGVPGFEVEVVGTDAGVDRRLAAVAEAELPTYPGLCIGVPSVPGVVEALADGRYDLVHVCTPGPAGAAAALVAGMTDKPLVGSYHTELAAYARLRSADPGLELAVRAALTAFYGGCRVVLSPSAAADAALVALGVPADRLGRWDRGVDAARFGPARRRPGLLGPAGRLHVLYAGRLTTEKGIDLLAAAFLAARGRDPRLHLCVAGGGPEEARLRERLGAHVTFLGWLEGDALADAYAGADLFLFASTTDTFGQVVLEAQASGVAVVAVDAGGPRSLVRDGVSGLLRPPDAEALAGALLELAAAPEQRARLARGGLAATRGRTWERALARLGEGYGRALGAGAEARRAA
jgi:glycosyltransferase involved in cell wall biosynthesis/predicted metal-dependent phosphoesterase TrpH